MTCSKCGSENTFQFEASPPPRKLPGPAELPLVCRDCGQIVIDGKPVDLPEVLAKPIRELAENARAWGKKSREELEQLATADPEYRIEAYMAKFYKAAYLDGFFRALAFFQHNVKEGRLVRMRKLWPKIGDPPEHVNKERGEVVLVADLAAYNEFEQLLLLNAVPETSDATRHSNKEKTIRPGDSSLPG